MGAARRTIPFSTRQRQFIQQMATRRAQFRRRKEPIQWKIGSPAPFRLVFQFAEYFTERRINDVLGEIVVLNHPGYVQSFDKDRLVIADDLRREFLKRIPSGIADFGVESGYFQSGLLAIVTALGLARQAALKPLQSLFALNQGARIFELFAVAGRGQRLDADIDADFGLGSPERLNIGFNEDADKIALTRISADCQIEDFGVVGKWTAPDNVQRRGLLGQRDLAVSTREGIGGIARRLAVALDLNWGYCARFSKKLVKAVSRLRSDCCRTTELTSERKDFSGSFFHLVSLAAVA